MDIEDIKIDRTGCGKKEKQLILFIGDYVQLHQNFYGENSQWLEIVDIEPYDICLLSNGIRVCASSEYISSAKSPIEYKKLPIEYKEAM